ncbi:MAG: alpha/beta hydrolase [Acidimicrobiia bacterium]|jgi:pimeloyl-ACP methyl ester carboxylesterase
MPEVISGGVKISYDSVGDGRPLILLHGMFCDLSWWTEPGYVDSLSGDHRLANIDLRGHGASGKPHQAAAYSYDSSIGDVLAVADAERLDRFAIWGHSYGGQIAWMTAAAFPERVGAIVTTGAWDPRPDPEYSIENSEWVKALRRGGTTALVEQFAIEDGEAFDREFPEWARTVTLRGDPEAWIATYEAPDDGVPDEELRSFPVPVLLIAGEFDDLDDDSAKIAAMVPNGQTLRLPGLGHGGSCIASELTIPTARSFLDRWFP